MVATPTTNFKLIQLHRFVTHVGEFEIAPVGFIATVLANYQSPDGVSVNVILGVTCAAPEQ
jgi:hypothetical protein